MTFLARAFAEDGIVNGISRQRLCLCAPVPDLARSRRPTCHSTLVVDGSLVTARTDGRGHRLAHTILAASHVT